MKNQDKLGELQRQLQRLVEILRLDNNAPWTVKFEEDLVQCSRLLTNEHIQSDVYRLAQSITYVFAGMGSFNDYRPSIYDPESGQYKPIPNTDDFEQVASAVFRLASSLKER